MTPDKCPKRGAGVARAGEDGYYGKRNHFRCGKSIIEENHVAIDCLLDQVDQLTEQRNQLLARVKRLEEAGDSLADATIPNGRSHERWKEAKEAQP